MVLLSAVAMICKCSQVPFNTVNLSNLILYQQICVTLLAAAAAGISAVPVSNPQLTRQDLLGKDLFGYGLDDGNELGHRFKRSPVFPLIKKPKPFLLPLPIPIPIG